MKRNKKNVVENVVIYALVGLVMLFFLFPFYWAIVTSFKTRIEQFAWPPIYVPTRLTGWNYYMGLIELWGFLGIKNSLIVASANTALVLALAIPAAYALARIKFKGSEGLANWILSIRMLPPIAVAIPMFILWRTFGWLDTHQGLIITYTVINLPFAVWMLKGFFEEIPPEIEDAALVDGCSRFGALRRVLIPLVTPGVVATTIFTYIFAWNEFLLAVVLTRDFAKTLPVVIPGLIYGHVILWGAICAVTLVGMIPIIIAAIFLQKYMVRGLTFGAVRGTR